MNILPGSTLAQLRQLCESLQLPRFAATQIADWVYKKRTTDIAQFSNLSLRSREQLSAVATAALVPPVQCQTSVDGTKKYLFDVAPDATENPRHAGHHYVEAVYIPDGKRATLCVSSQVGCKMGCAFCVTGQQGFHGNLSAAQIVNQILAIPESQSLTNVVFMGMGEPLDNLPQVLQAIEVLTADWGLGWSPHRITLSSVGVIPTLKKFLDESKCDLAISLHNPFPEQRGAIMPVQRAYPIEDVVALLRQYDWTGQRHLTFEYTMLRGRNDSTAHAAQLLKLLRGLPCHVNLIRFHASPSAPFQTSDADTIRRFQDYLNSHHLTCTLRASRGEDIQAACGLLAGQAGENPHEDQQ